MIAKRALNGWIFVTSDTSKLVSVNPRAVKPMPAVQRRGRNFVAETWKEITADQPKYVLGFTRSNGFASPHKAEKATTLKRSFENLVRFQLSAAG